MERALTTNIEDQDGRSVGQAEAEVRALGLEARVVGLDTQVVTLAAGLHAASRMRVATPPRLLKPELRLVGGRLVRRILEKGRIVEDYSGTRRTG